MPKTENLKDHRPIELRKPTSEDGSKIWELIRECKPLDENSMYCNLIQTDHFADTCVVAERDGDIVGWISGYMLPSEESTFFVWQVAVSTRARGEGLGKRMLQHLHERLDPDQLKTTITKDNDASWALFKRFAEAHGAELDSDAHFEKEDHFDGHHSTEHMVTISFAEEMESAAA